MTKRAILYARVSYDDRDTDGRNLKGQLEMGRERAVARDYSVLEELAEDDKGASGASFELPQLGKALELARDGKFDVFVVREIDRLSRNLAKQLAVEAEFKRHGVVIDYVLGDYPDTSEGRLNKNIRASIAEFEREQINIRMTRARRRKVKDGSVMTHGRAPYGYRLVATPKMKDGKELKDRDFSLKVYEPEARVVRLIFAWYAEERASHLEIKRRLKAMSIPTKAECHGDAIREGANGYHKIRGSCEWASSSLHHILNNTTYIGDWRYAKGTTGEASVSVPAIVDPELFLLAARVKQGNKANGQRQPKYPYLLRARCTCGHCGSKMQATPNHAQGKLYLYYRCQAKRNYARDCALGMTTFSAKEVDAAVWAWVRKLLAHPELVEEGFTTYEAGQASDLAPLRERLDVLDELVRDHRAQLARLLDLYLAGDFPKELLAERKQRLESTVAGLEKERGAMAERLNASSLTGQQKADIRQFVAKAGRGLEIADKDFSARRRLVELLDVTATLAYEDGQKVVYARCVLGELAFSVVSKSTSTQGHGVQISLRYVLPARANKRRQVEPAAVVGK